MLTLIIIARKVDYSDIGFFKISNEKVAYFYFFVYPQIA